MCQHGNFEIDKNRVYKANVSVFSFKNHINNINHQVPMNLFNFDHFTMSQLQ